MLLFMSKILKNYSFNAPLNGFLLTHISSLYSVYLLATSGFVLMHLWNFTVLLILFYVEDYILSKNLRDFFSHNTTILTSPIVTPYCFFLCIRYMTLSYLFFEQEYFLLHQSLLRKFEINNWLYCLMSLNIIEYSYWTGYSLSRFISLLTSRFV